MRIPCRLGAAQKWQALRLPGLLEGKSAGFDEDQLASPLVLKISNYLKKQTLLSENTFLLRDVDPEAKIPEGLSPAPAS